jgi:hypothetical protein
VFILFLVGGPSSLYHKEEYLYLKIFNSTTSSGGLFSAKGYNKKREAEASRQRKERDYEMKTFIKNYLTE